MHGTVYSKLKDAGRCLEIYPMDEKQIEQFRLVNQIKQLTSIGGKDTTTSKRRKENRRLGLFCFLSFCLLVVRSNLTRLSFALNVTIPSVLSSVACVLTPASQPCRNNSLFTCFSIIKCQYVRYRQQYLFQHEFRVYDENPPLWRKIHQNEQNASVVCR